DSHMYAPLCPIAEQLVHRICAGQKQTEPLHERERHVAITAAFYESPHGCGMSSADRQGGKMQHSERGEIPCQVSEVTAMIIADALSFELVARFRDGVKTLDR